MQRRSLYFIIILALGINACSLDKEEAIPSYIHVPSVSLETQGNQGSNSHKITEVWVYANDLLLGAYSIPATIPILESGDTKIEIFPGIKDNGILTTPEIYPMYASIIETVNLVETEIDTLRPVFNYRSGVKFAFIEDFESTAVFTLDEDGNLQTALESTTDFAKDGLRSGVINLSQTNNLLQVANELQLSELPTNGTAVYLELDYRNDIIFSLGLIGYDPNNSGVTQLILSLREKEDWNKVYIKLTEELQLSQLASYRVIIDAMLQPDAGASGKVYLDNIKLVYL